MVDQIPGGGAHGGAPLGEAGLRFLDWLVGGKMIAFLATAFGFIRNSWIGKMTLILGGALFAVLMVFSAGGRAQRKNQKIANLENYVDVQKRVDRTKEEAARMVGAMSDDELHDSLRKHSGAFRE